jgi:hypothetical protein
MRGDLKMKTFKTEKEFKKFCKEVANKTWGKYTTIIFKDGTISTVTGSWTAQKPVWASFTGEASLKQIENTLKASYETDEGIRIKMFEE